MIRIIQSSDERAVAALLDRAPRRDPASRAARRAHRERRAARAAIAALLSYAKRFDGLTGDVEVTRAEMRARRGLGRVRRAPRDCGGGAEHQARGAAAGAARLDDEPRGRA